MSRNDWFALPAHTLRAHDFQPASKTGLRTGCTRCTRLRLKPAIVKLLDSLDFKSTVRLVLQRDGKSWVPMSHYAPAFKAISSRGHLVVIEIADSEFDKACDSACYASRAKEAAKLFPGAIIEGINEANGTGWLSNKTHEHFIAAAKATKEAKALLMLTTYSENPETYRAWVEKLPAEIRAQVDYVVHSEYPDDNEGHRTDMKAYVSFIAAKFPNAWIGYGEWKGTDCWKKTVDHPKWVRWCGEWFGSQNLNNVAYAKALRAAK